MLKQYFYSAVLAASAIVTLQSPAHAALDAANHSQWDEDTYYNGFGGAAPAGLVESSAGFSTIGDYDGRVLSNAAVTTNTTDNSILTTISTSLFAVQDANLYKFSITNLAAFSASLPSTSLLLALFSSNGKAIALSKGGTTLTGANTGITTAGTYYLGIATPSDFPQNTAGTALFNVTSASAAGVYTPSAIANQTLSTNPYNAWTLPGGSTGDLISNTSFTAGGSTITLAGSNFAVTPEPASLALVGVGTAGLIKRRRRA